MNLVFKPFIGLGQFQFGISPTETKILQSEISGFEDFVYENGKLCKFSVYPDDVKQLIISGKDVLKMDRLSAALHLAYQSNDYGQAQGGSLYFMDLGCAILQFESPSREFLFFAREYETGEPLLRMTL